MSELEARVGRLTQELEQTRRSLNEKTSDVIELQLMLDARAREADQYSDPPLDEAEEEEEDQE